MFQKGKNLLVFLKIGLKNYYFTQKNRATFKPLFVFKKITRAITHTGSTKKMTATLSRRRHNNYKNQTQIL